MPVKKRVFVSSVVEGFEAFREAARRGIVTAGGEPVLVNEDFPASTESPRNACLDAIDSCDAYLIIVGKRGGWKTPSEKLVVEEELEHAIARKLPVLGFLQDSPRDSEAERLAARLSDYVEGRFRGKFRNEEELEREVEASLRDRGIGKMIKTTEASAVLEELEAAPKNRNDSFLRFVLAPERAVEVIDIVRLESEDFAEDVLGFAHDRKVRLFRYEAPKGRKKSENGVVFVQSAPVGVRQTAADVSLEVRTDGWITIDSQVSGFADSNQPWSGLTILESDLAAGLASCFRFADALYSHLDPYRRHSRFLYGASLASIGMRQLINSPPGSSLSFPSRGEGRDPLVAENPRLVSVADLQRPDPEIERTIVLFRRKLGA